MRRTLPTTLSLALTASLLAATLAAPPSAPPAPPSSQPTIQILDATWGGPTPDTQTDVTVPLRDMLKSGKSQFTANASTLGSAGADPLKPKELVITFRANGQVLTRRFKSDEQINLASLSAQLPADPAPKPALADPLPKIPIAVSPASALPNPADGPVKIAKLQTSIKILYVLIRDNQEVGGNTGDLILTATRGAPRAATGITPVTFVSPVGRDMQAVLDDVLRAVRVTYPEWQASRIDLSFDDRYTKKDGGSIGAAIGTLLLSSIRGFDIDPALAMTGDVTADGKIRAIGGVSYKIRGATTSGCTIVALPADNYPQLVDAFVYEGPKLVTNAQVLGMAKLEDAAALARTDRDPKLKEALDTFAKVQEILKKTPEAIHAKANLDQLAHVLELAPNHYSAKLLQLVGQNKQPKKLSATATEYYDFAVLETVSPEIETKRIAPATPIVLTEAVKSLQKLHGIADPQILPLVIASQDFVEAVNNYQSRRIPAQTLQLKMQAVTEALAKISANRDLMDKMLHEGI